MHPVIHVAVSLLIGIGIGLHSKRKYLIVLVGAVGVNGIIDLDYVFVELGLMELRYFHTGIGMLYIPILILIGAHLYERNKKTSIITRMSILVLLVALSHLIMDTFTGEPPVMLYYPISLQDYTFDPELFPYAIVFFIGLVAAGNVIESYLYNSNEGFKELPEEGAGRVLTRRYRNRITRIKDVLDDI